MYIFLVKDQLFEFYAAKIYDYTTGYFSKEIGKNQTSLYLLNTNL